MKKILVYLISVILFSSCNSIFDVFSTSSSNTTLKKDITLTIKNNTNNNYNAYAVFTNEEYYSYAGQIKITSNTISSSLSNYTSSYSANIVSNNEIIKHPTFYDNGELKTEKTVDNNISASIMANTASYSEGDTKEFNALYAGTGDYYTDKDDTNLNKKQATLRKQVSNVSVTLENGGTSKRTLNIWVADDVWGTVTQEMIDTLADKFLQTGENNDIYDYVTSIYGDEWFEGDDKFSNTIYGNKEIDILIYNINEFNTSDAKVLGFFDSRHNYTDYEYSNQEIMFFIDSGYFSLKEGGNWDITYADNSGKGPATILSTLAHEFTHMIMFYQKYYKQGISIDTWINEMCAMITEDIVADKLGISNPINIRQGEFSMYGSSYPVNEWTTTTIHYSNKYFFGAFLLRNFGIGVFHDIVNNEYNGVTAIEKSLESNGYNVKFEDLLRYWGEAVITSDNYSYSDIPYNYSDKNITYGGNTYTVYDINVINNENYSNLTFYRLNDRSAPDLDLGANIYYKLTPYSVDNNNIYTITIPYGVGMNIIIKDSLGNVKENKYFTADEIKNSSNFTVEILQ